MRRIVRWFRSWFVGARIARAVSGSEARIAAAESRLERSRRNLAARERRLDAKEVELNAIVARMRLDLEEARRIERLQEEMIAGLRDELKTANEVTIPALVAANTLAQERIEADIAVQVRKRAAATPGRGEDE